MMARWLERYVGSPVARWTAAVLFLLGTLLSTLGIPGVQRFLPYRIDLDVYRTGGQLFRDGGDLYGELPQLAEGAHLPFTYPPLSAEIFSLLTFVPLSVASTLVTLGTIACLGAVINLLLADLTTRGVAHRWWITVAVMAVALWAGPVRETLGFGQVNVLLMGLVLLDCLRGRGRWWGGVLVGLATAVKLTPAVFLLYFLLRRDWRSAGMAALAAAVFTGLGHLLAPADSMRYWTFAIRDPARIGGLGFASNQSINGLVHRLGLEGTSASALWFGLSCLAGLGVALVVWRLLHAGQPVAAVLCTALVALLCSPVSWGHHWVWAVPMIVLLLNWASYGGRAGRLWWVLAASGAFISISTPHWWFPHGEDRELDWGPLAQLIGSAYLVWAVCFLVALGCCVGRLDVREVRGNAPHPPVDS